MRQALLFVSFLLLGVFLPLIFASCNYNVSSVADLNTVLSAQSGWTTVPTICFAAGDYSFSIPVDLSMSQYWVGPQQGVDASCGRQVNPPCARLISASSGDTTVEAVLTGTEYIMEIAPINFTVDGLVFSNPSFVGPFFVVTVSSPNSATFMNSYFYNIFTIGHGDSTVLKIDRCYASSTTFAGSPFIFNFGEITITNSFFFQTPVFINSNADAVLTVIGNTFLYTQQLFSIGSASYFENNAFYFVLNEPGIDDNSAASVVKKNLFWVSYFGYQTAPGSKTTSIDFEENCFIEFAEAALNLNNLNVLPSSIFNQNYFGSKSGPTVSFENGEYSGSYLPPLIDAGGTLGINFTFSPLPLTIFAAPNVCPHPPISLDVKPHTITLGEQITITLSITIDPLIQAVGIDASWFDSISAYFYLTDQPGYYSAQMGGQFSVGAVTWTPSTEPTLSFNYTITDADISAQSSGEYFVLFSAFSGPSMFSSFQPNLLAPLTINFKPDISCFNQTIEIDKGLRQSNPQYLQLTDLGCETPNWQIVGVNTTELYSYTSNMLVLNIAANMSSIRPVHYQIAYDALVSIHRVVTQINIINHNPVVNNTLFTWTYPLTQQIFPAWNIISNCTDQDGDTLTVVQIQRTKGRTASDAVQLDPWTIYFVPEKAVLHVSPTGDITLSSPSTTNPVTAGAALPLFWKKNLSFQFEITDGDVVNSNTWGTANINSI